MIAFFFCGNNSNRDHYFCPKTLQQSSILFPLMVLALVGVRKLMDFVFSPYELDILDGIMPEGKTKRRKGDKKRVSQMKLR